MSDQITLKFDVRRNGEDAILIGDDIRIVIVKPRTGETEARVGIQAPRHISILRDDTKNKY